MAVVDIPLYRVIVETRCLAPDMAELPAGTDEANARVMRVDELATGDLIIGAVDQPTGRGQGFRYANDLCWPYEAHPVPRGEVIRTHPEQSWGMDPAELLLVIPARTLHR